MFESVKGMYGFYTKTECILPEYSKPGDFENLSNSDIEIDVTRITEDFNLESMNLLTSSLFELPDELKHELLYEPIQKWFKENYEVDNVETTDWMIDCAAMNAILDARTAEYNRNSQLVARAGDGYIPGVSLDGAWFSHVPGWVFSRNGAIVRFPPRGETRIFPFNMKTLISRNWLGFAATGGIYFWRVQYHAILGHFRRLATRITRSVGVIVTPGGIAPMFLLQSPSRRAKRIEVNLRISCDRDLNMQITMRNPRNYVSRMDLPATIRLRRGTNDIKIYIACYPYVPPAVHHLEFESRHARVVINRFEVITR